MRIEYHRTLLADRVRNAAFHAALQRVIVAGETTVADIGAGTGFLGFLAAKLGAKRVDLYEAAEIAGVARKLLRHNRLANARIAQVHSTEVAAPERVDVVVCETLGNYPFEENIIATLNDARARYLKKGGVIIPHRVEQLVAPVVGERYWRELARWDEVGYGLDFEPAKTMSLNNIYVRWFEAGDLLEGGARPRPGTRSSSTAATRRRAPARRPGARAGPPRSTAWRCGGARSWCRGSRSRPDRSTRARTGSSSTAGAVADRAGGRANPCRAAALHHVRRRAAPT